ncbi:MAG TPA: YtxH domain-containing protein [Deltaproteobacteria bacterium]|nr:YtxH domain-containing protein [Deltaproteobacteria bacterium]HQB37847.1 YtxH domain-containing protein [Deltaproteobacteria bacterium]
MNRRDDKIAAAALLMVAGGIIGASLALLFAPQSGERTRRDISRGARKIRQKADETVDELSDNIVDLVDSLEDKAEELLDKGKELAGGKRRELIQLIEDGTAKLQAFRAKLGK